MSRGRPRVQIGMSRRSSGYWMVMGGFTRWLIVVSMPLATPRPYAICGRYAPLAVSRQQSAVSGFAGDACQLTSGSMVLVHLSVLRASLLPKGLTADGG